jgi:Fe(3+) dicitrate transport protein
MALDERIVRLTVVLALCTLPAAAAAQAPAGTVRGVVTLAGTHAPVEDAVVSIDGLDRVAQTSATGAFTFVDVPAGPHRVRVRHPIVGEMTRTVTVAAGAVVNLQLELAVSRLHEEVTVTGLDVRTLLPGGIEGTPGAASVLTGDQLRALRPYTLHDALDFVAGVRTIDDDALGRRSGIGIRGSQPRRSRRVLLLEDGVPINAATYLDPSGHYTPPIERLEQIDVLKGAGQIVHGPLNNHGIINFRTRRPTLEPETVLDAALGSHGTMRRHVLHSRTAGPVGLVVAYSGIDADGVFDSERHRYDDLFGAADWTLRARQQLSGSVTYFRERSHYDERNLSLDEFAAAPREKLRLDEGMEFNTMAVDYWKAQIAHRLESGDRLAVASHVFVTDLDRPRFESRRGGPLAERGYMRGRERRYTTYGASTRAEVGPGAGARWDGTWEAGLRWERQRFDNRNTVGAIGDVLEESSRGRLAVRDDVVYREDGRREQLDAWAVSGFVQHTLRAGRAAITPGVRLERYTQRRDMLFRPGAVSLDRREDTRTLALPGVGVRYEIEPGTQLYAGIHRGYSPAIARTEEFPLVPETGVDMQAGLRSTRARGLTLDVALFHNRLRNTLVKRTVTDQFGANVFINSGSSRVSGVDAAVRLDSRPLTGARLNAFVQMAYGYANARFTASTVAGNRLPESPLHAGSITAGVDHAGGWSASATLSAIGSFFTDEANTPVLSAPSDAPTEIVGVVPGHALLSARATYAIGQTGVTLWLQGRNLTDRLYITDVQDGLRPGVGRTVSAGARVTF